RKFGISGSHDLAHPPKKDLTPTEVFFFPSLSTFSLVTFAVLFLPVASLFRRKGPQSGAPLHPSGEQQHQG
ncbi:unnamed protein product, partial [Tenebrio molitor]